MPTLDRADATLYFERTGAGAPVLFIQGVGVAGGCWRPQADALAGSHQSILFDNRGLGRSVPCQGPVTIEAMAADAAALMDHAGWDSAHVIGHSMGGVIAQQLALDHPRRVRGLGLLCTFGRGKDAARLTPWVLWMTLRTRVGTRAMRRRAFLEMIWPEHLLAAVDQDALAVRVGALVGRDLADSPAVLMQQVRALAHHDTLHRLGELAGIPTLVISAEHDPISRLPYGVELARAIPGATHEVWNGASHGVTIQDADRISARLLAFLRT